MFAFLLIALWVTVVIRIERHLQERARERRRKERDGVN